ncbi:MAG: chromate transporter [Clostridia bacterium]|nr:chromate transporter [Clostridia bacterium]
MSKLLFLIVKYFEIGLMSFGGGLATLPFLMRLAQKYPEYLTQRELIDIIAISESTPGPLGVNAASFFGYRNFGVLGAILTTISLVTPSFFIILILFNILEKYKKSENVQNVFKALRPASIGLIAAAAFSVFCLAVFDKQWDFNFTDFFSNFNYKSLILFTISLILMNIKKLKKVHPVVFIAAGALIGILLKI